jgi:hypothetical protein
MQFCHVNIRHADTQVSILHDQISHCSYTDAIWIIFLGMVVDNWICKRKKFFLHYAWAIFSCVMTNIAFVIIVGR